MKHYKDPQGKIFAYEADGSQDAFIPADLVAITDTEADAVRNPAPSLVDLKANALAEVRALRAAFFPALAGLQSEALARGNATDATAIAAMQQGARDITALDLTGLTTKAQIDLKFKQAWLMLVATAPASVVAAFKGLGK